MTRAVLFDLDDTLFDHRESAAEALRRVQAAHECFRRVPFDEFEMLHSALLEELHPEVLNARLEMDEARRERFRRLFKRCGMQASEELCATTAHTYRTDYMEARRAVAGAASLVAAVRSRAKVGIVSNNMLQEQRDKLEFCGLSAHVDALIVSEEAGVSKPDPAIFRMALDALGVTADQIGDARRLMVGGRRRRPGGGYSRGVVQPAEKSVARPESPRARTACTGAGERGGRLPARFVRDVMSVAESEAERVCRDSEVRRLPHRPTVTNQDRLRCFVPHAEPIRHFVGHLAVTLDGNHFVGRASTVTVEMCAELIESLGTDAARAAVFEQ